MVSAFCVVILCMRVCNAPSFEANHIKILLFAIRIFGGHLHAQDELISVHYMNKLVHLDEMRKRGKEKKPVYNKIRSLNFCKRNRTVRYRIKSNHKYTKSKLGSRHYYLLMVFTVHSIYFRFNFRHVFKRHFLHFISSSPIVLFIYVNFSQTE